MSHAINALVLLACDTHRGEWLSLHRLAQRIGGPVQAIQHAAENLAATNQLAHATHAGHPYWGVGVEGVSPPQSPAPAQRCDTTCDYPCIHMDQDQ